MSLDPRTEFHRVVIRSSLEATPGKPNKTEMVLKAFSTGGQRSSRVASLCGANGLVVLPPAGSHEKIEAGSFIQAVIIGEIEMV